MLGERRAAILRLIIEYYIKTGEPIGSKTLCNLLPYAVSSATIRNEMAHLSNLGYLEQPHTSAGRVPSPMGYRLYVNELMGEHQLTIQETQRINEALNLKMEELDRCLDQAGKVLSQISDYPVFTAAAPRMRVTVKRYDLLMVEENAFIAVVMTDNSVVKNKLIRIPDTLGDGQNMNILIGPENVNEALKDTSVVMASYDIGDNMRGVIGVVGPTRMDYAKVTARLSYFADSLTRMFGKGELPSGEGDGDGQAQE